MDAFLIATAILGSVVLLFKYAVPPQPPIKRYCERCTKSSLLARMRLIGQRYSSVTSGFGIKYREIKLKRLIVSIARRAAECGEGSVSAWESEIISSHSLIESCFEQGIAAARLAHSLGHVNGYPRIYLLCGELVSALCGNTDNSLVKCAVNEFERYAPLTAAEKDLFCGMLEFCLCELLYNYASAASVRNDAYLSGREDGAKGNVDLDRIDNADYVCGVTDCATSADGAAIGRIRRIGAEKARCRAVPNVCRYGKRDTLALRIARSPSKRSRQTQKQNEQARRNGFHDSACGAHIAYGCADRGIRARAACSRFRSVRSYNIRSFQASALALRAGCARHRYLGAGKAQKTSAIVGFTAKTRADALRNGVLRRRTDTRI